MRDHCRYQRYTTPQVAYNVVEAMDGIPAWVGDKRAGRGFVSGLDALAALVSNLMDADRAKLPLAVGFNLSKTAAWGKPWSSLYGAGVPTMRRIIISMDGVWWSLSLGRRGSMSLLWPTPRLKALWRMALDDVCECRGVDKLRMEPPQGSEIEVAMTRKILAAWNTLASNTPMCFDADTEMPAPSSHRVFNDVDMPGVGLSHGGRVYMLGTSYQQVPKEARKSLMFRSEKACEWDFRSMHTTMAWALAGGSGEPPDFYSFKPECVTGVGDKEWRAFAKVFLNAMLNAKGIVAGARAVRKWVNLDLLDDAEDGWMRDNLRQHVTDYGKVLDAFLAEWPWLKGWVGAGKGMELQRQESDIMLDVLAKGLAVGVLVLPMHDGALCPERNAEALERWMREAYKRKFGQDAVIGVRRVF